MEDFGHQFFAGNEGPQADIRGGVRSLHDDEGGVGDAGGVDVGVLLPEADDLEGEELAADVVEEDVTVAGDGGVEGGGVDGFDFFLVGAEGGDFFLDVCGGAVFELIVVLMQAGGCARGWGVVEVDVGEVFVGDEVEGLNGAVGGEMLGGSGGGEHECSEEGNGSEVVEAHVTYMQCKTWGEMRGRCAVCYGFSGRVYSKS